MYLQQSSKLYLFKKDLESQYWTVPYVKLMVTWLSTEEGYLWQMTQRGVPAEEGPQNLMLLELFLLTASFKHVFAQYRSNRFMTIITRLLSQEQTSTEVCWTGVQQVKMHISSSGSGLDYINNTIKSSTELSISSRPVQVIFCRL